MVNSTKKVNDEFGIDNYENPYLKYNPHTQKSMNYSISKDMIPRDSISLLQKAKKKIPGPSDYKTGPTLGEGGKFFISKGKIPSYFEEVVNKAKITPGVGKYDLIGKKKILGNYTYATQGGGFTDAAQYFGQ